MIPRTERGRKLLELRKKIVDSGTKLLTVEEINQELGRNDMTAYTLDKVVNTEKSKIASAIGFYVSDLPIRLGLQHHYGKMPVVITVPGCETQVIYKNIDSIPDRNVPCPCGDPTHWVIAVSK